MTLPTIDLAIIIVYLVAVLAVGVMVRKAASRGIDSYFLGENKTSWWVLAASGSSSYFDITGTMWIVSLFMLYGVKGMWEQWIWGFTYAAFFMTFMGKWIRRSGVVTGAEWMRTRFGAGRAGEWARGSYALLAVVTLVAFITYSSVGIGKFGREFLPGWTDNQCALLIVGLVAVYATFGGFVSVVLVDLLHTVVLSAGAIALCVFAFVKASAAPAVQAFASGEMGNLAPPWHLVIPQGASVETAKALAPYEMFGLLLILWVVKGVVQELGGPPQMFDFQRFLAARDSRDASKIGALWGIIHILRWPFVAAIVVLALSAGLHGLADKERVLPTVLHKLLPDGLRGFTLAALLAAFMSSLDAMVNAGASYVVRDLYQRYTRPKAGPRELVYAGYVASALLVVVSFAIMLGFRERTIAEMFNWIMLVLGGAVMIPCVLRWYWWRFNGWGFTVGVLVGIVTALAQGLWFGKAPIYHCFPVVAGVNLVASIIAALLTQPTDRATLKSFYRTVHPGGFWGPVARDVAADDPAFRRESFARDIVNTLIAIPWIMATYFFPVFLMFRQWGAMAAWLAVAAVLSVVLYFTWYKHLPAAEAKGM